MYFVRWGRRRLGHDLGTSKGEEVGTSLELLPSGIRMGMAAKFYGSYKKGGFGLVVSWTQQREGRSLGASIADT